MLEVPPLRGNPHEPGAEHDVMKRAPQPVEGWRPGIGRPLIEARLAPRSEFVEFATEIARLSGRRIAEGEVNGPSGAVRRRWIQLIRISHEACDQFVQRARVCARRTSDLISVLLVQNPLQSWRSPPIPNEQRVPGALKRHRGLEQKRHECGPNPDIPQGVLIAEASIDRINP
jgi:hypothetical protein